jgi:glycosyltransferase involved in cell wall biosynthesis
MMPRKLPTVGILHYSAPPVIGGVENVILAQARLFTEAGFPTTVLTGKGKEDALPRGATMICIPKMDSQHPQISQMNQKLDQGSVPAGFEETVRQFVDELTPSLDSIDVLIVHNIFTKHFNLALTAALFRLLDTRVIHHAVAWCHDLTWTSLHSRSKVYPRYPWNLLRTYRSDLEYVTVSQERKSELIQLFRCPPDKIRVIYNGVDPTELLTLSSYGLALINQLHLWDSDLNLLMPVRVTQAKNIEFAMHVVAVLKARGIRPKLVVTGPPDPHDPLNREYFRTLLDLREKLGVISQVRFIYESGPVPTEPFTIGMSLVAELLRVTDALFLPSHREGFGMPVLEAGLAGIPVFCADSIPAASEIGAEDVIRFSADGDAEEVADLILKWVVGSPVLRLRRRVRQNLTWNSIFHREILPLVKEGQA